MIEIEENSPHAEHHPSRELFPDFTLRLPNWLHEVVRRLEQMSPTWANFTVICFFCEAVDWIKKLMYIKLGGMIKDEED